MQPGHPPAFELVQARADGSDHRTLESYYALVAQPEGVSLDRVSRNVHGIDEEACRHHGRPLAEVLGALLAVLRRAAPARPVVVGHDVVADAALLVDECLRKNIAPPAELRRAFGRAVCTKLLTIGRCRLPAPSGLADALLRLDHRAEAYAPDDAGGGGYKWPSLDEAVRAVLRPDDLRAFTQPVHDARGDVERCRAVFRRMLVEDDARRRHGRG